MRIGVIQSCYIPWRGYFDFIDSVDLFVIHDDLQYTKGDWRNRNKIKTEKGLRWLTVPVHYKKTDQLICDTEIDYSRDWQRDHLRQFEAHYRKAPFFSDALAFLAETFAHKDATISQLNVRLLNSIGQYLQIATPTVMSSIYGLIGMKTERLMNLRGKAGGDICLSGPSAKGYLDEELFRKNGIRLEYKAYEYEPFTQLWGDFAGGVSILDLIANEGSDARRFLRSQSPNLVAVE